MSPFIAELQMTLDKIPLGSCGMDTFAPWHIDRRLLHIRGVL